MTPPRKKQRVASYNSAPAAAPSAARQDGLGDFGALPDAVVCYITVHLDLRSVLNLACASKLMRLFCYEVRGMGAGPKTFAVRDCCRVSSCEP